MLKLLSKYRFSTSPFDILNNRGQVYQYTSPILKQATFIKTISEKYNMPSVYCGYDPTSDSLHLGNLLSIIALGRLSTIGLRPVFLVGGATAQIGDPSGKKKQRPPLQKQAIYHNIRGITQDINRVYDNIIKKIQKIEGKSNKQFKVVDNMSYYESFNILQFLNQVGRHFRLGVLLSKQNISTRLATQQGLAYSQFSYTLLQSYDFYRLFKEQNCILQLGGSDQWGNITNGCDLVKKKYKSQVFGLTLPLLTTANGMKFGKTQNNALFINPQKTSSSEVYNYFYSTSDQKIEQYLKLFTFLSQETIKETMKLHLQKPQKRIAQKLICQQIFSILYSQKQKIHSQQTILKMKKQQLLALKLSEFQEIISSVNTIQLKRSQLRVIQDFPQLITYLNLKQSKGQVRRQIQNGGVYVNNQKITIDFIKNPVLGIIESSLIHNTYVILKFGKKNIHVLTYSIDE